MSSSRPSAFGSKLNNLEATKESEENIRENVEHIKSLNIRCDDKVNIMLVYLGMKPATCLTVVRMYDDQGEIASVLDKVGLHYRKTVPTYSRWERFRIAIDVILSDYQLTGYSFDIAKKEEDAEALHRLQEVPVNDINQKEIADKIQTEAGRLYGFPETAIEAFVAKKERIANPEEYNNNVGYFVLSKDHYKDELEVMKKWSAAIRKYAPGLYEKAIRSKGGHIPN